jgi:hypothetical protein
MHLVERGDILAWNLHTWFPEAEKDKRDPVATGIKAGSVVPLMHGDSITTQEILNALAVGGVPAAVVMCGCATFQFAR